MTVIALNAWKRSGKDTAAQYLVEEYGYMRFSFADALKQMVAEQYDIPVHFMHNPNLKERPIEKYPVIAGDSFGEGIHDLLKSELKSGFWTPRALCILEGSVKRSVYSNYWVRTVVDQIKQYEKDKGKNANAVISDMRYGTEADTLKLLLPDVITARIERFETVDTTDPSERDLDRYSFDWTINNKGTKYELHEQIDQLMFRLDPSEFLRNP